MKTYLEIQVPLCCNAQWFQELRRAFDDFPVRWQFDYYHITMAFLDEAPAGVDFRPMLIRYFSATSAPVIILDRLDFFSTWEGRYIIYLGSSSVPEPFLKVVNKIREEMKNAGALIKSDFKLHVTLGRLEDPNIKPNNIKSMIKSISLPSMELTLTDVDYRVFRGRNLYETKLKP